MNWGGVRVGRLRPQQRTEDSKEDTELSSVAGREELRDQRRSQVSHLMALWVTVGTLLEPSPWTSQALELRSKLITVNYPKVLL